MKAKNFVVIPLLAALLIAGCDLFAPFSIDAALGEWDFPDRTISGKAATSVHLSVMSNGQMLDMRWDTSENGYLFACDGAMNKNVFTGTYIGWDSMLPLGDNEIVSGAAITATLSMSGGKISISFSGSGPLNGVTVTEGTLSAI